MKRGFLILSGAVLLKMSATALASFVIYETYDGTTPRDETRAVQLIIHPAVYPSPSWVSGFRLAAPFSTGDDSCQLDSARVHLAVSEQPSLLSLQVCSDNGGIPGDTLETLSNPAALGDEADYVFQSDGLLLSPNTTYWVKAEPTGAGLNASWWCGTADTGYAAESMMLTANIWTGWQSYSSKSLALQVLANPVPEPASITLFAATCLLAWALTRNAQSRANG